MGKLIVGAVAVIVVAAGVYGWNDYEASQRDAEREAYCQNEVAQNGAIADGQVPNTTIRSENAIKVAVTECRQFLADR